MKHVGFTGSRQVPMTRSVYPVLTDLLQKLERKHGQLIVHHGDCLGMDEICHDCALDLGLHIVTHPPLIARYRAWTERILVCSIGGSWMSYSKLEVLEPKDYMARNHDIVDASDLLIASPTEIHREQRRSGTWATVRYARKKGKEVLFV